METPRKLPRVDINIETLRRQVARRLERHSRAMLRISSMLEGIDVSLRGRVRKAVPRYRVL